MADQIVRPYRCHKTQILRSRHRDGGSIGPVTAFGLVEIDFLPAKAQRGAAAIAELLAVHPQHTLIPRRGDLHVAAGDDHVVKPIDGEAHYPMPS